MTGEPRFAEKIMSQERLVERFGAPRSYRLVFTNGCFDILHRGHVEYIAYARSLGDELIIGLNSDRSVRELKGTGRPLNSMEDRAMVLAALQDVSAVAIFDESTPLSLISQVVPDILVKGGDYEADAVVGADLVRNAGGEVVIAPLVRGRSTSGVIQKLKLEGG